MPVTLGSDSSAPAGQALLLATVGLAIALLFFFAGTALSQAGARPGARWPWIGLALALSLPFLFVHAYVMPSGSMEDTLLVGDRILVRVFPRPTPKRGDLVVFHYPLDPKQIFVKRVIGVAGDRIRMRNRVVSVNGSVLREPYVTHRFPFDPDRDNLPSSSEDRGLSGIPGLLAAKTEMLQHHVANGEIVVPERKYFVLGDNRDNSLDSRYWGFVDQAELIGKPLFIYDSEAGTAGAQVADSAGRTHIRWARVLKVL